jgi:hypothetical protein
VTSLQGKTYAVRFADGTVRRSNLLQAPLFGSVGKTGKTSILSASGRSSRIASSPVHVKPQIGLQPLSTVDGKPNDARATPHSPAPGSVAEGKPILGHSAEQPFLPLDEIQHLPDWAARRKGQWDRLRRRHLPLHVVATGSSALRVATGSRESLAGRLERMTLSHWSAVVLATRFRLSEPEAR